jgi:hypothetical protein
VEVEAVQAQGATPKRQPSRESFIFHALIIAEPCCHLHPKAFPSSPHPASGQISNRTI